MADALTKDSYGFIHMPSGSVLDWNMAALTIEQLDHEYELCHQVLYGFKSTVYPGVGLIGLLNEDPLYCNNPIRHEAVRTWKLRFKRVKDELFERQVLLHEQGSSSIGDD